MKEFKGFRADRLREAMKENGATIEDIAVKLHEIDKYLGYKETEGLINGCLTPKDINHLVAICKAVNVSADYL